MLAWSSAVLDPGQRGLSPRDGIKRLAMAPTGPFPCLPFVVALVSDLWLSIGSSLMGRAGGRLLRDRTSVEHRDKPRVGMPKLAQEGARTRNQSIPPRREEGEVFGQERAC
jgi:hypothetical protein